MSLVDPNHIITSLIKKIGQQKLKELKFLEYLWTAAGEY